MASSNSTSVASVASRHASIAKRQSLAKGDGTGRNASDGGANVDSTAEEPRQLSISSNNSSVAWTPYPVTVIKPYAPFYTVKRSQPFQARQMWKGAILGIKALKRMKLNVGDTKKLRSELLVVTGHTMGHMMLLNADNFSIISAS